MKILSPLRGSQSNSIESFPGLTPGAINFRPLGGLFVGSLLRLLISSLALGSLFSLAPAQTDNTPFPQATELQHGPPLTNQEFVQLLYQLPRHPEEREKLIDDIRKRGIAFPLTDGLRSLVATKSGNDTTLRHTLEGADRRRRNPVVAALPPSSEGLELLELTRKATLGAAERMPDFLVKQNITRYVAYGNTKNWQPDDRLTVAVSYRQSAGEQYKLLSINGLAQGEEGRESSNYSDKLGGTTSTGEYVSILSELFKPETQAEFQMVDTDTLRGRRTIVYEYVVKKELSHQMIKASWAGNRTVVVGFRGRVWIDREANRVLRLEDISTEIPGDFPVTAANSTIDYDWVTINELQHLLPLRAVVELTARVGSQIIQTRNEILFRGYRKFGAEVKIIDIDEKDFPPDKPEQTEPAKPESPPALKPQAPKNPNLLYSGSSSFSFSRL